VPYYGNDNNDYVNGLGFCCNPTSTDGSSSSSSSSTTGKLMAGKNDNAELQQFYYHPDHLGSSSYISNLDGEVVQHIEYVPFGEVFLEEKNAKWNTPYLFTSKELDRETGLYYFGARYQDPKLGIFISVDPLAEKFAGYSSYNYALNNPLGFIDPTGMGPEDPPTVWGKIKAYVDYQWNTKIPNDLKKIGRELDNGKRWDATVKDVKRTGKDIQQVVKNNKVGLLKTAKVLQKTGDKTVQVGLVGAAAGAPFAGVGAAPGLAVAKVGGVVSTTGSVLEIGVKFITNDEEATKDATTFIVSKTAEALANKALPGAGTEASATVKEVVKATREIVKSEVGTVSKKTVNNQSN